MSNPSSIRSMLASPMHQFDLDVGISREEFGNHRRDERHDVGRAIDAQRSAWRRLQRACDVIRLFEIGKDLRRGRNRPCRSR